MFQTIELALQTMLLGIEAHSVMSLRMRKIWDGGPDAFVEAQCMMLEKTAALTEATAALLSGEPVRSVVLSYRSYVRANEARLLG